MQHFPDLKATSMSEPRSGQLYLDPLMRPGAESRSLPLDDQVVGRSERAVSDLFAAARAAAAWILFLDQVCTALAFRV